MNRKLPRLLPVLMLLCHGVLRSQDGVPPFTPQFDSIDQFSQHARVFVGKNAQLLKSEITSDYFIAIFRITPNMIAIIDQPKPMKGGETWTKRPSLTGKWFVLEGTSRKQLREKVASLPPEINLTGRIEAHTPTSVNSYFYTSGNAFSMDKVPDALELSFQEGTPSRPVSIMIPLTNADAQSNTGKTNGTWQDKWPWVMTVILLLVASSVYVFCCRKDRGHGDITKAR